MSRSERTKVCFSRKIDYSQKNIQCVFVWLKRLKPRHSYFDNTYRYHSGTAIRCCFEFASPILPLKTTE